MRIHELQPAPGAKQRPKRVGRGIGSGHGKTATRGHKGQWARAGGGVRPGFEGGQMPLHRRMPKRGFSNALFKKEYEVVNLDTLARKFEVGQVVTPSELKDAGLNHGGRAIKVLGEGQLDKALEIHAHAFSKTAVEKITAAGGKVQVLEGPDAVGEGVK